MHYKQAPKGSLDRRVPARVTLKISTGLLGTWDTHESYNPSAQVVFEMEMRIFGNHIMV